MSSPNPYFQSASSYDDLDRLVTRALKALNQQVPPDRVWKRIRAELKEDESPPRRFQTTWLPLMVQPAFALLVVLLGTIGLHRLSSTYDTRALSSLSPPPPLAMVAEAEESTYVAQAVLQDKADLQSLSKPSLASSLPGSKAHTAPRPAPSAGELGAMEPVRRGIHLPDTGRAEQPPLAVPRDPSEGRAFLAELSSQHLAAEERQKKHSGPYEWHR